MKDFYAPKPAKIPKKNFSALQRLCGSREIQPTMRNGARADLKKKKTYEKISWATSALSDQSKKISLISAALLIISWLTICRVRRLYRYNEVNLPPQCDEVRYWAHLPTAIRPALFSSTVACATTSKDEICRLSDVLCWSIPFGSPRNWQLDILPTAYMYTWMTVVTF